MARPYPGGRRRRPGRRRARPRHRPPKRYRGGHRSPVPEGFTTGGFRRYYRWLLPELQGHEKREFFNRISLEIILGVGLGGLGIGYGWFGVLGALLGFCLGIRIGR